MQEAMASDYAAEWKQAADLEYESLICNDTWELVELPGCTSIGCNTGKTNHKFGYRCTGESSSALA